MRRLAFIVSHPIQYYAPLHQRLARRDDVEIKVFFTWHDARAAIEDSGFKRAFAWDIPLTEGYAHELVPNVAADPGTHHFQGLRNPTLLKRVCAWRPDVVHITGWAWASHLGAMRALVRLGIPTLFRGDSHLLDERQRGPRWWLKRAVLKHVFAWPNSCLYAGQANRAYYTALGVPPDRLHYCPHSIDVGRFAEPAERYEREARDWRRALGIVDDTLVLLFAGKFEPKKRPLDLMRAFLGCAPPKSILIMVGSGELEDEVQDFIQAQPDRFRRLPFQNQSRMPIVYRLGDLFVLPSGWGETWGLAINEALACGRPVLVSDRVGCAHDVIRGSDDACGMVYAHNDEYSFRTALMTQLHRTASTKPLFKALSQRAWEFDVRQTEAKLMAAVEHAVPR